MANILTLTLNPSIDLSSAAPALVPNVKLRCDPPQFDPGGGGINVARAILQLGGSATAMVAIGGAVGAALLLRLAEEGVPSIAIQGPGETRQSLSLSIGETGYLYRFVLPGPTWNEQAVERALMRVEQAASQDGWVVLSGSHPPGVAKEFPTLLARQIRAQNVRLVVDTSGPALRALAEGEHRPVDTLRMDDVEAEDLAGHSLPALEDTVAFAQSLRTRGVAEAVMVARGAEGNVLVDGAGAWIAVAPPVEVVSAVGAGDSFVGAYVLALSQGMSRPDALRRGSAAASAACTSPGTELCTFEDTDMQWQNTELRQLA